MGFRNIRNYSSDMTAAQREQAEQENTRKVTRRNLIVTVAILGAFCVYMMFNNPGSISAVMNDEALGVVTLEKKTLAILLKDIDSVELCDNLSEFDWGVPQSGTANSSSLSGVYVNDTFGEYLLHVNIKIDNYIIVHYNNNILIFNTETTNGTIELYTNILNAINSQ